MKIKAMPHQLAGVKFLTSRRYSILAFGMGTGKTLTALMAWQKKGGNLLIVCPSYLVLNWAHNEIQKWFPNEFNVDVITKGKEIYNLWDTDIAIISYDLAMKAENLFEWADTIIMDEAHGLKSMAAKRTEFMHRVIFENNPKNLYLLTGTPIQNRVEEFYSLLALCYYSSKAGQEHPFFKKFPDSLSFADHFSNRHEFKVNIVTKKGRRMKLPVVKWAGFRNVDELKKVLSSIYMAVKTEDVLDLDPIIYHDILMSDVEDKELLALFAKLNQGYADDEEKQKADIKRKVESAKEKVPFTIKYVQGLLEKTKQVVIYTDHVESCEMLAKVFKVPAIHAGVSNQRRHSIALAFKNGEQDVICATYGAFSTGVDLTTANHFVANDKPWVPGVFNQAIYRIQRITQTKQCHVHSIYGSPQDAKIGQALELKEKTIKAVT